VQNESDQEADELGLVQNGPNQEGGELSLVA
jgi:hypothetical protein